MQETFEEVDCGAQGRAWKYIEREPQDLQRQLLKNALFFSDPIASHLFPLPNSLAFQLPFPALLSSSSTSFCCVCIALGLTKALFVAFVLEFSTGAETHRHPRC